MSHDGGLTWSVTFPHFTTCSGGTAANHGDYQRASDPWITFSPDGTAYFISLSLTFAGDASQTGSAILVSKSTNGGDTWSDPVTLQRNIGDAVSGLSARRQEKTKSWAVIGLPSLH